MVRFRVVLRNLGAKLHESELDENAFTALLLDKKMGESVEIDQNILILSRKVSPLVRRSSVETLLVYLISDPLSN